jgi:predicted glycosyltransferase involved in capsule biosynthesis
MAKIDLKDVSFIIPTKLANVDRENNLRIVVDYMSHHLDTNIIIHEQDTNRVGEVLKGYNYEYLRFDRPDGLLHRTKQLNDMCKYATTPIVVNCDLDVLMEPLAYEVAANLIRNDEFDVVIPYNGQCRNIAKQFHPKIFESKNLAHVPVDKCRLLFANKSVGGMFFINRQKYIDCGMENENFVSWGYEDNERIHRFTTLEYRISRLSNPLFHLDHIKCSNSKPTAHTQNNVELFNKMKVKTKEQVLAEIKTWPWCQT